MKRILCFVLSLVFVFSLVACNKEGKKDKDVIDIEYFVKLGQIPECEYSIGYKVEDLKKALSESTDEEAYYDFREGKTSSSIDNGSYRFYYKNDNEDRGISYIVSFEKAFGFDTGSISVEILNAFEDIDFSEEELDEDNSFFLFGAPEGTLYKYEFGDYTVAFVFIDNALSATAVYTTDEWE